MSRRASCSRIALAFLIACVVVMAPAALARTVVVMTDPGVIQLPQPFPPSDLVQTGFEYSAMQALMQAYGVETIGRAVPDEIATDTVRVARTGETVYLPDMTNVFTIILPDSIDAPRVGHQERVRAVSVVR